MKISQENLKGVLECADEISIPFHECLAAVMVMKRFDFSEADILDGKQIIRVRNLLLDKKADSFERLASAYEIIFSDLEYYPVPKNCNQGKKEQSSFENDYGEARDYGGKRSHEGIDIFGTENLEGYYPIVSVTDGVVEKIGWLTLGGYRIGIRSPHGGYFYYAHLSGYCKEFQEGDQVKAGELLGFMGNTGYGPEGTKGKFPVHLHFGIYINTSHQKEMSINPYPVLLMLKKKIQKYHY
ncbi:M23 family metallopeptidase [bacterium]|nr:M23 family metallopeptidase [bacterium]MDY3021689.1 M23 family metallopeptidase [Oliverpabstia sp.]